MAEPSETEAAPTAPPSSPETDKKIPGVKPDGQINDLKPTVAPDGQINDLKQPAVAPDGQINDI